MKKLPPLRLPTILLAVIAIFSAAYAIETSTDVSESPYFEIETEEAAISSSAGEIFPLQSTQVDVQISGVIANVTVEQVYQNRGQSKIDAVYVFPASTKAAVHGMKMQIGDRLIEAKVHEKQKAKDIFETAKLENKTASLLEQKRPNVFQMSVANILPDDEVKVILSYTEYLEPTEKIYSFVYPTVVGPRYSNQTGSGESWLGNPYLGEKAGNPATFELKTTINSGLPLSGVKCNTHDLDIVYLGPDEVTCKTKGDPTALANRDLVLDYRLDGEKVQTGLLLHEAKNASDENFFLLTMQPPNRVDSKAVVDREYIFVVDVSGSMSGFPIKTAKNLMSDLVGQLGTGDRFNILKFASSQDVFSNRSVDATPENLKKGMTWMDASVGGGGTELVQALRRAYRLPGKAEDQSRIIVIITDGYVSFERDAFELVEDNLDVGNLFAFGIGRSVNRYLIDGMAGVGKGEPFVVTQPSESKTTADRFRKYISQPVFTNIETKFDGFEVYDVIPKKVPDVFADRPVTIFGKWRGKPKGKVTVTGFNSEGIVNLSHNINSEKAGSESVLPLVWARERIAELDDYVGVNGLGSASDTRELKQEITNLGLTYNLLTRYTSFVAVDNAPRELFTQTASKNVTKPSPFKPTKTSNSVFSGSSTPGPGIIPLILAALASLFGRKFLRKKAHAS